MARVETDSLGVWQVSEGNGEPYVGKTLNEKQFVVADRLIDDYFDGLDLDRSAFDAGDAPVPSMIATDADNYFGETAFSQQRGHLWMRQEWRFSKPMEAGAAYTTAGRIEDIYKKRDRTVVNTAFTMVDGLGEEVLEGNHHQSFLLDAPVDQVEFRKPTQKAGARKFVVPEGKALDGFDRTITLEMCGQYFHGNKNYHTDLQASKELGFQEVVVGGRMTMAYLGHLLDGYFGDRWFATGALDVKFTNPCWPTDHITMRGVSSGVTDAREDVFAWIEKDDGTIILIANASAAA